MHEMTQDAVAELRGWMLSEMKAVQRQQQRLEDTCARQEQALLRIEALLAGACVVGEAKGGDAESGGWQVRDQERTGVLSFMHANVPRLTETQIHVLCFHIRTHARMHTFSLSLSLSLSRVKT